MSLGDDQRVKFLMALRDGYTVSEAAKAAGAGRRTFYDLRERDAGFRDAWEDAVEEGADFLENELRSRALDREDKDSAKLLMFLLKKVRPAFKDTHKTSELKVTAVREFDFSKDEIEEAQVILDSAKKSLPPAEAQPRTDD